MDEGADLPGHLRVVGRAPAACAGDLGPGLLLGVYEGQPASAELHIESNHQHQHEPGTNGFNKNIYLFIQT